MSEQLGKVKVKRFRPSYIYSIISVSLVLFMIGLLGLIVIHAHRLSEYFKENVEIAVIFKDDAKEIDIYKFQKQLEANDYVKKSTYVSKEAAAEELSKEYNEDFIEMLGYNPLYASVNLNLYADYANPDSIAWIEKEILQNANVREVYYQHSLLQKINANVNKIGIGMLFISILFVIIAITLIDNTIRLAMYSNRFLIKSMQMVGAMRWFIIKPFIRKSIVNGVISSLIAITLLIAFIFYAQQNIEELKVLQDNIRITFLFMFVILIGIFISWISTHLSVRKYLRMKLDDLY